MRGEYECARYSARKFLPQTLTFASPAAYYISMYELKLSRPSFYRVKSGQTASGISAVFGCPVPEDAACGDIIFISDCTYKTYAARVGDTYQSIAAKFGVSETELKELNGGRPVYPTCVIFVPEGRGAADDKK